MCLVGVERQTAAEAHGMGKLRVMIAHILPNAMASVLVTASLQVGAVIIAEAF